MEHSLASKSSAQCDVYSLCIFRHIDDIIDGDSEMEDKIDLIKTWRQEINNIYGKKKPTTEIGRRIYKNCMRFKLPKKEFIKFIDAITMDIPNPIQAPSLKDFKKYCHGVAGVPGNLSLRIFGCKDEALIDSLSVSLGSALQITNILRDVKLDAHVQRLYIPKELLIKAKITSTDPLTVVVDKNLVVAREELAKMAYDNFAVAYELIKKLDKKTARPVNAIAFIYKRYFDIMQNRGWEIISPQPKISKCTKLYLALKAFMG